MREMKDTGVVWCPTIPKEWHIEKVKNYFYISKDLATETNPTVLKLARSGICVKDVTTNEGQMAESYDNYNKVKAGDLLLNPMDLYSGANCNVSEIEGVISPAYTNLRLKASANSKFYDYYFKTQYWAMAMFAHGKGVSYDNRWTINAEGVKNYEIPVPSIEEQNAIVESIQRDTAKVDALIANQEAQIEKLKAYKQSLITEVVTKGLDPNVPMKDSGVEWIGNIAANHSVWKLKFMLSEPMMYGANESGESKSEHSARYIRITDITADNSLKDDENNLYLANDKAEPYILSDKDILFARSGGTVGKSFMYREEYGRSAFAGYLIKAKCNQKKLIPEYLLYYTQSSLYEIWKNMIFIQATIQNIGANKYSNMEMVVMPIAEQKEMVDYLDEKCSKVDSLIAIKNAKIEKLSQYKKSLIYEYVTGKKEVI